MYIGWPGSVHDARVLANSNVFTKAEAGTGPSFPNNKHRICGQDVSANAWGDPAYPLLPWLMNPFSDCGSLTRRQRKFNYQLSRARIEIAFGRLKSRWRCLLIRNNTGQQHLVQVVAAYRILHNVCEVHNDGFDETWQVMSTDGGTVSASGSHQISQTQPSSPLWLGVDMLNLIPDFTSQNWLIAKRFDSHAVVFINGGTKQRVTHFI